MTHFTLFLLASLACAEGLPDAPDGGLMRLAYSGAEELAARSGPVDAAYAMAVENLKGSGVPRSFIDKAFADPRVRIEEKVVERMDKPAEKLSWEDYRKIFITEERISAGERFARENHILLRKVGESTGVDPFVFTAIVGVESSFGKHKGSFTVFNALYTIANCVPRRARWAGRELAEYLKYCLEEGLDPQEVRGSYAGAFGFGQFIPSSFNKFAVDFDGDGKRDPYGWADVLASVANYLVKNGYRPGEADYSPSGTVYPSIFAYNHSDNYVRAVLELRAEILKALVGPDA
jgi:membrane-bound lytic murein transglycosylase B